MPVLQTTINHFARGHTRFELTPNLPVQRTLVDTYQVRLWIHDQLVYDHIQSVRDRQMRHLEIEQIAKSFCCVHSLLGQELRCRPAAECDAPPDDQFLALLHAQINAEWLIISLAATRARRLGALVHVHILLQETETEIGDAYHRSAGNWGGWQTFIGAHLFCTPANAIQFGTQLQAEVQAAEQTRIDLGIPKYDDPGYGDETL